MSMSATFVVIWIASTVGTALVVAPILFWAVRSGQFADRDHARYLPLLSDGPKTDAPEGAQPSTSLRAQRGSLLEQEPRQGGSTPGKRLPRCDRNDGALNGGGGHVLP